MLCELSLRGAPRERPPWKVARSSLFSRARLGVPEIFLLLNLEVGVLPRDSSGIDLAGFVLDR